MRKFLFISLLIGVACSRAVSDPREVSIDQNVALMPGESAHIAGSPVLIKLLAVQDSRCPSDVQCITAGEALNIIQLSGAGADRTDTLKVNKEPKSTTYGNYRIEL